MCWCPQGKSGWVCDATCMGGQVTCRVTCHLRTLVKGHLHTLHATEMDCILLSLLQDGPPLFLNSITWRGVAPSAGAIGWPYINGKMAIVFVRDQLSSKYSASAHT
jgi:hypothetical protein